jgi:hypothetical protein
MSYFDDASLAFLPKGAPGKDGKAYSIKPTNGDGDFTFSRGSNLAATRVGPTGLIEKGRENLLTYSNDFSQWTKLNTTPTSGQSGYDGTNDATEISFTAGSSRAIGKGGLTTSIVNFSIYVKAGTHDFIQFTPSNSATTFANFEISTSNPATGNTGGLVVDSSIEDVGNGWYRCSAVINNSGSGTMWVWIVDSLTSGRAAAVSADGTFFVQDAQLEIGLAATDYIESGATTGKAGLLEDQPRFDYSGGATCPSLLLEPSRTNLIPYSEYLGGNSSSGSISFTYNDSTSLEGLDNAALVVSTSNSDRLQPSFAAINGLLTISLFVKHNGGDFETQLNTYNSGDDSLYGARFNVTSSSITITSFGSGYNDADYVDYGNGWYRIYVVCQSTSGTTYAQWRPTASGSTPFPSYPCYGFQVESGSYPTSYIPNHSGGSVTRGAEGQTYTGFSSLIGQTEGTLFLDIDGHSPNGSEIFSLNRSTANAIFIDTNIDQYRITLYADGVLSFIFTSVANTDRIKIAIAYQSNNFAVYANGLQITTNNTWTWTPNTIIDSLNFNAGGYVNSKKSSKFNQVVLFKERLSNTNLETLTTL